MPKRPLEGVRVLDMTIGFAGAFGTEFLADLGAEVILVESFEYIQTIRMALVKTPFNTVMRLPEMFSKAPNTLEEPAPLFSRMFTDKDCNNGRPWDRAAMFNRHARNKLSCTINLPSGKDVALRLAAKCDILVENNIPGMMKKMGLSYEDVKKVNPEIIYVSSPGFGQTGPWANWAAWAFQCEAAIGHLWMIGYDADDHPLNVFGAVHMDAAAGSAMALASVMALRHRRRTGKGQFIDMATSETVMVQFPEAYIDYTMNGRVHRTIGNRDFHGAPSGVYRCYGDDNWVAITIYNDKQWQGFCQAIGNPDWCQNEKFATYEGRRQHHDELDELIGNWAAVHNHYEVMFILQKYGVPSGPAINEYDASHDPQLIARDYYEVIQHPEAGVHMYPGFMWKYTKTPMYVKTPPPGFGENNDYVFKEVIGMSDDEYWDLAEREIIGGSNWIGDVDYVKPQRPAK